MSATKYETTTTATKRRTPPWWSWCAALALLGAPPVAGQEGLSVLTPTERSQVPRAAGAGGCEQQPDDGSYERALGFPTQNAANFAQRFELEPAAEGSEWFLDDVCLTLTRSASAGVSTFNFVVFRDEGGLPGDVLAFRTATEQIAVFPGSTVCGGDFALSLIGLDAIHVGLSWHPQQANVFLMMDESPATPLQVVSMRSSAVGPSGLAGWSPVTSTRPDVRAAAIGLTLFESTPEWVTTEISPPAGAGAGSPRLDVATSKRIAGIAVPIHGGADHLGIHVYQDAEANRAFFQHYAPSDLPATGDFEKITKLLNGSRFVGDSILPWPGKPNRFFFVLVDGDSNLLLGILDVPPAGVEGPVEIDWHMPGQAGGKYSRAAAQVTKAKEVRLAALRLDGRIDIFETTGQGAGVFVVGAQIGAGEIVGGSNGALGPSWLSVPILGDVVECLIFARGLAGGMFEGLSDCEEPFGDAPDSLGIHSFNTFPTRAQDIWLGSPEELGLGQASLPSQDGPDALLISQRNDKIEASCLEWNGDALEPDGQVTLANAPAGMAVEWAVVHEGSDLLAIFHEGQGGKLMRDVLRYAGVDCMFEKVGSEVVPGASSTGFSLSVPEVRSEFGASLGGLIIKDKLWFNRPPGAGSTALFGPRADAAAALPQLVLGERLVPRPCATGESVHCLNDERFQVTVDWRTQNNDAGVGRRVDLTDDSGLFYFFGQENLELIAKVIDACGSPFQSFWVFTAGLTDVEYVIEVLDGESGRTRHYVNPLKKAAQPVQDNRAFRTCALGAASPLVHESEESSPLPAWARDALRSRASGSTPEPRAASPRAGQCTPSPTTLCLGGGRFKVEAEWVTKTGSSGKGKSIGLTDDTGAFWFFDAANVEILVKVIDACASAFDSFWVFAAGLTNVEVGLTVTDTQTGTVKVYDNPLNRPFRPVQDTHAFETCP